MYQCDLQEPASPPAGDRFVTRLPRLILRRGRMSTAEDWNAFVEEMRKIDGCNVEKCGTLDSMIATKPSPPYETGAS